MPKHRSRVFAVAEQLERTVKGGVYLPSRTGGRVKNRSFDIRRRLHSTVIEVVAAVADRCPLQLPDQSNTLAL